MVRESAYELLGLHAFGASNVRDADRLLEGIRWVADQAQQVAQRHGQRFRLLDAGGGLGIPYADEETPLDLDRLGRGIAAELATWATRPGLADVRLLLEPGRFLVGPAGAYLTRIVRTKPRAGRTMAITDGGIHHLLRPALVGEAQRIVAVGAAASRTGQTPASVVGPLCTGLDVLALEVSLPEPRTGDLLAVLDAGAYGFTESMPLFLSHPVPAEVAVSDGIARVARLRQEPGSGPRPPSGNAPFAGSRWSRGGTRRPGPTALPPAPVRNTLRGIVTGACPMRVRSVIDGGTSGPYIDGDRTGGSERDKGLDPIARDPSTDGEKGSPSVGH